MNNERTMRAKLRVTFVQEHKDMNDNKTAESISMCGVARSDRYPEDGSDENNTYAKFSPQADFRIMIANPALFGKFSAGQMFYADFTEAK